MELQGKKAVTHDFLSLYKDSASQDSKPPPQEFLPKTHDFLQPLGKGGGGGARGPGDAPPARVDIKLSAAPEAATGKLPDPAQPVRPGGFCTYSVSHVTCYNAPARPVGLRPDWFTCALPSPGAASGADRKAEYSTLSTAVPGAAIPAWGSATAGPGLVDAHGTDAFALWEESALPRGRGTLPGRGPQQHEQRLQSPSPSPIPTVPGGSNGSSPCISSSRQQLSRDTPQAMASEAKSNNRSFADDDDDEEEEELVGKREPPSRKELTMKIDGGRNNRNCNDQKASTPRSKHSETEQRRRSKINDRFRILRDLIPHSDQKRDKASLLLEAIEYVQFLQEKLQKYESSYPGWNQNTKLMPWKINQTPGECMVNSSHITKNGPTSTGFRFPAESTIPGVPTVVSNTQVVAESDNVCSGLASKSASVSFPMPTPIGVGSDISQLQQRMISDSENMGRHEAQWLRPCAAENSVSSDILSGEEELAIDKGSISLSSKYSEGLLTTLTQALRSSGIDLSQASISVQINLGKHAIDRQISNMKDQNGDGLERARKRHKSDSS